ncbi:endo-1,4-beta-xylanase, partial [Rhizoctonia solani AG-3 Rhs1AP]
MYFSTVTILAALTAASTVLGLPNAPIKPIGGLDAKIKAKGKKYFGTCAESASFTDPKRAAIIHSDFGQLTPENSAKWETIEPSKGKFKFGSFDAFVNMARRNGKLIRGHTFVWYSQLAPWVNDIGDSRMLTSVIEHHITTVAKRYKGKIYAWDVVKRDLQRGWHLAQFRVQPCFVAIAFKAARAADPKAKLYINEYNLESSTPKRRALIKLVQRQIAAGTPIDGIGSQTHLQPGDAYRVHAALTELAKSKVSEVAITELDIVNASGEEYSTVVRACLDVPKCVGITVWGVSDKDSWRATQRPLLFNGAYKKKAAYEWVEATLSY